MKQRPRDRVRGVILGLAAGDKNYEPSQMAWRLAKSLADKQCFDPDDVIARYLEWHRQGSLTTAGVTRTALGHIAAGVSPRTAVWIAHEGLHGMTAGVNSTHRVAPLAAAAFVPDDELEVAARLESALTHAHPLAGETAAAVATLCRRLIRGDSWDEALMQAAAGKTLEVVLALQPALTTCEDLSEGGFAPQTLRAAVWYLHRSGHLAEALSASRAFAGPDNHCPVLVGAIGGARWGADAIPQEEVEGNPLGRELREVAESFSSGW